MSTFQEERAFERLIADIRSAKAEFRHRNDNSASLFRPKMGVAQAYDTNAVESALERYSRSLSVEDRKLVLVP